MKFLILLAFFSVTSLTAHGEELDLHSSLLKALERSPDFDIQKLTSQSAEWNYKNSWAALLPQADLEASHVYSTSPSQAATPWTNNLSLSLTENLYDNGDSWRLKDIARLNRTISQIQLEQKKQKILLDVAKAYFTYSLSILNLQLQKEEISALRQQFKIIEGRYHQGIKSNRDFLRIKAQLERSEISFSSTQISTDEALQVLRTSIGVGTDSQFKTYVPDQNEIDSQNISAVAPENTFEFRIADLQNQVSDLKYRTVARAEWPRISLKSSYSYNIPQYIGPSYGTSSYTDFQAMLLIDFTIWDWGKRHRDVEIADNQRKIEYDQQDKSKIDVVNVLTKTLSQNSYYFSSFQRSKQLLKDQNQVFESLNNGYRDGKISYLELITGLDDLFAARSQNLNLQFSLLTSKATMAYYKGNLNEVLGIP